MKACEATLQPELPVGMKAPSPSTYRSIRTQSQLHGADIGTKGTPSPSLSQVYHAKQLSHHKAKTSLLEDALPITTVNIHLGPTRLQHKPASPHRLSSKCHGKCLQNKQVLYLRSRLQNGLAPFADLISSPNRDSRHRPQRNNNRQKARSRRSYRTRGYAAAQLGS